MNADAAYSVCAAHYVASLVSMNQIARRPRPRSTVLRFDCCGLNVLYSGITCIAVLSGDDVTVVAAVVVTSFALNIIIIIAF